MTKLTLVPIGDSATGTEGSFEVDAALAVVLGRDASCDVRVGEAHDVVSRRHVTVRWDGQSLVAHDSSSNGLFVNGQRVSGSLPIHDEDELQLGTNGPRFVVALDPKPVKAPPPAKATRLLTPTRPPQPVSASIAMAPSAPEPLVDQAAGPAAMSSPGALDNADIYLAKVQESAGEAHNWLTKVFAHAVVFVGVYLFFMLWTYYLPYVGSNSATVGAIHAAAGSVNKAFWAHLICLGILVAITWYRGSVIGKTWIMIFPIIATMFDIVPVLSWIPLVPTIMHLAAIIMGVRGRTTG